MQNIPSILHKKNLRFLFYTITFTKHLHQFIYYIHFFIKIIFSLTFFIISHLLPPNPSFSFEYTPFFFTPSLSLSSPLFLLLFFFFWESLSFLFSVNPLQALHQHRSPSKLISINTDLCQPITNLHQNRSPSTTIHINPSSISINTDPNHLSNPWSPITDPTILFQWLIFFLVDFVVDFWFCVCGSVYQRKKEHEREG